MNWKMLHIRRARAALALVAGLLATGCSMLPSNRTASIPMPVPPTPAPVVGQHVVVDLDRNQVRFMDGERVVWSAPAGTGTGLRLKDKAGEWNFDTPNGTFLVQRKELNPVWIAPDWYFIENKLPIPAENSPKRRQPGQLGAAAVYLAHDLAIHGTDKPELLGQRVSHGCIRLANEYAVRLFHNVQVGTPVMIVGTAPPVATAADSAAAAALNERGKLTARRRPAARKPTPRIALATPLLLRRLDRQLAAPGDSATWTTTTSELITRGLADDAIALRGVLERAARPRDEARRREYAAYLADLYSRGSFRTTVSLSRVSAAARAAAAKAIVEGTMASYQGPRDARSVPWPTLRVPSWRLGPEGQRGWRALQEAENQFRAGWGEGAQPVVAAPAASPAVAPRR